MNDLTTQQMVSGIGADHTDKYGKEYLTTDWDAITALVDKPQQVDKAQAQWLIPSSHKTRTFKEQEQHGQYYCLWVDLDDKPPKIYDLADHFNNLLSGSDYELYNTSSATVDNQKARALIPLNKPLSFMNWRMAQQLLNDKLEALGIKPDRAAERAAQLCYLPNKGKFYGSRSSRNDLFFDPLQTWASEIETKSNQAKAETAALNNKKRQAEKRREELSLSNTPNVIEAFNQSYTPQEWMLTHGYDQHGNSFRHPNSQTGNYSATVKTDSNGVLRLNALSSADPLYTDGQGGHDAFSCFTVLVHNRDHSAALIDAGDNLLTIGGVSFNKAVQRDHMQKEAAKKAQQPPTQAQDNYMDDNIDFDSVPDFGEVGGKKESKAKDDPEKPKIPFSMKSFSLSGQSEIMKTKMLAARYVLDRIAILGQATTIYAKPNTGKTLLVLWMLIESIKANRISGENVYYINADDDYKGLVYKTSLAEKHGFQMLAPGHNDFESVALQGYMRQMIDDGTASGTVIILDTLKKFTDLMDKRKGSAFMDRAREYISNGGTLIMLAHTNKNRDADGKAVFSGTSDVVDDCDCVYILDEVAKTNTTKQVLFENIKCRGDVASELAFSYSVEEGKHYQYRLESVEPADKNATAKAKEEKIAADARAKDQEVIDAITEAIEQGITQKTPLIVAAHDCSGISRRRLTTVLTRYKGTDFSKGDLWREEVGDKNAKNYHLLSAFESTKDDYSFFKIGE
jgi:hypothetical protein